MHDRINPVMKEGKPYCRRATDCKYYTLHRTDGWFCDLVGSMGGDVCLPWWENRVEELENMLRMEVNRRLHTEKYIHRVEWQIDALEGEL